MYEIIYSETARKQLGKLERKIQERILKILERIRILPERLAKKFVNEKGYRIRAGDYRIIFDIEDRISFEQKNLILIIKIGHRSNIYFNIFQNL